MTSAVGLRERKKLATRAALSDAAIRQAVRDGLDAVTAESVSAAVGVSPRTFRNYFSSREEAVVEGILQQAWGMVEALRARPAGEPVWDSLAVVLPATVAALTADRSDVPALFRLFRDNPGLMAPYHASFERIDRLMADAIAERTGTDANRDLAPRLLGCVAGVAAKTAMELWAEGGSDVPVTELVKEGLAQLRAGIPLGGSPPTA